MTLILPAAVMLVNNDLTPQVQGRIVQQLFVSEVVSLPEYQARMAGTPEYYPTIIRQNNIRLMVVSSYYNITNPFIFDIGVFMKNGQCNVDFVHEHHHCCCDGYNRGPDGYIPCYPFDGYLCPPPSPCCGWNFPHRRLSVPIDRMYWHQILKETLPDHCFRENPCVQNNILYPLVCKGCGRPQSPFGTNCDRPFEKSGDACLFNLPVFCRCIG
jgi:hypothetical protein